MKQTTKTTFLTLFVLLASINSFAQLKGDTYAQAQENKSATILYTYAKSPGFLDLEADGTIGGICADIMRKFEQYVKEEKSIDLEVNYEAKDPGNFTLFLDEVKKSSGGVFGLGSTTITPAREKLYEFSTPYISNVKLILSHNSVATLYDIKNISNAFKGMTAVTVKNSTNEKHILAIKENYYPALKIVYVASSIDVLTKVIENSDMFTSLDCTYFFSAMKEKRPIKRHMIKDSDKEQFGVIMPKNNDWAPVLNEFMLSGFVGSMEYKKIISDNLGTVAFKFYDKIE